VIDRLPCLEIWLAKMAAHGLVSTCLHRLTWARERLIFPYPLPAIGLLPCVLPMERHLEVPECWQYSKLVFWFALVEAIPFHVFGDKWHHVIRIGTAIIGYGMPQADKTITGSPHGSLLRCGSG